MKHSKAPPTIPTGPGIYIFKDELADVIYIGKAKSLKKRVMTYFHKQPHDWKINNLMLEHEKIEFITTESEHEALLLEAELIQKHTPKYNVLLTTGQPFIYILKTNGDIPILKIVRNRQEKGTYFGPFLHKRHAHGVYTYLIETFKLQWCKKKIPNGCLQSHLGLCAGNCRNEFDLNSYLMRLTIATGLLKNKYSDTIKTLRKHIAHCNEHLAFEQAQRFSEYIRNLDTIFATLKTRYSHRKYVRDIERILGTYQSDLTPQYQATSQLQTLLSLTTPPAIIDCFDISHFQSQAIVGSCVRFEHGIPDKNKFRRFMIRSITRQNDYAALQEIVIRRYKHKTDLPDLILIDGGKGQLSAVQQVAPHVICISLAKREERVFSSEHPEGIVLNQHTKDAHILIALRNYAHHFAITFHRSRHKKQFQSLPAKK